MSAAPMASLVDGGRAFAEIWQALPRFRRAGRLFASGAGARLIEAAYRLWLRVMPLVRRLVGRFRRMSPRTPNQAGSERVFAAVSAVCASGSRRWPARSRLAAR